VTTGSQPLESRFWHPVAGPNDLFGPPRGKYRVRQYQTIFRGKLLFVRIETVSHVQGLLGRSLVFGDLILCRGIETCFKARREDAILILKVASLREAYCSICD
jgi:hypothetical protein